MAVKLFIIGLPGSGKSAIARYISSYLRKKRIPRTKNRWFTRRFNDYGILNAMAKDVNEGEYFRASETGGFDVIDYIAFDIALKRLESVISQYISSKKANKVEVIIIEFARNDYLRAFSQFNKGFLQDVFVIYLCAKVEICKQRVRDRASTKQYPNDDYAVSDYIFEKYYHSDDGQNLDDILEQYFGIVKQRVLVIDNNLSLKEAAKHIKPFIASILDFISSRKDSVLSARLPLDSM